jgi:hypothetical protein
MMHECIFRQYDGLWVVLSGRLVCYERPANVNELRVLLKIMQFVELFFE